MPAARTFTGDGCGCRFRPLGRSGCVTTAATLNPGDSMSADKLAQASSAVPKKTMRSGDMQRRKGQICDREKQSSAHQTALDGKRTSSRRRRGARRRSGHRPFSQRTPAIRTKIFVQFAGGQDEQQPFAHRLGAFAFRAIEFAGDEVSELLRHGAQIFASTRRMSRSTLMGDWVESIECTNSGP